MKKASSSIHSKEAGSNFLTLFQSGKELPESHTGREGVPDTIEGRSIQKISHELLDIMEERSPAKICPLSIACLPSAYTYDSSKFA